LKENLDAARNMGLSGRQYVENILSIEKIGKEMMIIYNHVLKS
jgi:hypothetical protein